VQVLTASALVGLAQTALEMGPTTPNSAGPSVLIRPVENGSAPLGDAVTISKGGC